MKSHIKSLIFLALMVATASCQHDLDLTEGRLPDMPESVSPENQSFVTQKQVLNIADIFMGAENPIPLTKATSSVDPEL